MRKVFKRQLIGYKPSEINEILNEEINQYAQSYKEHEEQLAQLVKENNQLKEQIKALEASTLEYRKLKKELEKFLFDSHIQACKKVMKVEEKFDEMIAYKALIVTNQVNKNNSIKASIIDLLSQVQAIVEK